MSNMIKPFNRGYSKNIKAALSAGVAATIYLGKEKITTDERIICLPSINEIFLQLNNDIEQW